MAGANVMDPTLSRRESGSGWTISIVVHLILALFLYWSQVEIAPFILDFTPVDFAPLTEISESDGSAMAALEAGAPIVELPRRPMLDETSPLLQLPDRHRPPVEALIPRDRPEGISPELLQPGRRMLLPTDLPGRGDRPIPPPLPVESSWLEGERQQAISSKLTGDEMFSISWEGPQRLKVSGELPKFPQGVNRAATVKLTFEVAPDGVVVFVLPVAKGVPELEQVSIDALRKWRFNALDPSIPQQKQRGEITFVFRLK